MEESPKVSEELAKCQKETEKAFGEAAVRLAELAAQVAALAAVVAAQGASDYAFTLAERLSEECYRGYGREVLGVNLSEPLQWLSYLQDAEITEMQAREEPPAGHPTADEMPW